MTEDTGDLRRFMACCILGTVLLLRHSRPIRIHHTLHQRRHNQRLMTSRKRELGDWKFQPS